VTDGFGWLRILWPGWWAGEVPEIRRNRHARDPAALARAMSTKRLLMASALAALAFSSTSCTLTKPFVCAVTTPIYVLGNSDGCGCVGDPRGAACGLVVVAAVGAVGGLVTGIISDIHWISGEADDPVRNIHDPFATNTSEGSF
tara:strand:+ start:129915 stop:130346 length:432 start_codon:yes stop_codon:yes gene_type:complete